MRLRMNVIATGARVLRRRAPIGIAVRSIGAARSTRRDARI
jgi:hypothetical protein